MDPQEFRLPKLGMQMVDGMVVEWHVSDKQVVERGQDLVTIQTDKVDTVLESPATGTINIRTLAGQTVEVGGLLATIY